MLDKNLVEIEARLKPMVLKALEEYSLGVTITSWQIVFVPSVMTEQGPRPAFGAFYQCRSRLLGSDNYLSQVSAFIDPFISQEGINEAIADGCSQLREMIMQQQSVNGDKQ